MVFVGDDDASSEPNWGIDCSTVVRVKELHISSPILAAKSPFFYKVLTFFLLLCSYCLLLFISHVMLSFASCFPYPVVAVF